MDKEKLVNDIFDTLEKEHINLFHSISRQEFEKEKQKLVDNVNSLNDIEFEFEMRKLFALFKDAHTVYDGKKNKNLLLNANFDILNNKAYIITNEKSGKKTLEEVAKVNGTKIDVIIKKLKSINCYETEEWLNYKIANQLSNFKYYILLGIASEEDTSIEFETLNSSFSIGFDYENNFREATAPYDFRLIKDVLYIRYSQCMEDKEYPFEKFVDDIIKNTKDVAKKFVLDVRNNAGGNSEILNPLQNYLKSENISGAVLINNGTFSSGRFAVARFKKNLEVVLVGQPTGGATKSYGYNKILNVDGLSFCASIKYWDFSNVFNYDGAIQPDILVKKHISDIENNTDFTLEKALEILNKDD